MADLLCAVCSAPARKWRGFKRPLCRECYDAARSYSNVVKNTSGYFEGLSSPPKNIAVPNDGNWDPWSGKNKRLEE